MSHCHTPWSGSLEYRLLSCSSCMSFRPSQHPAPRQRRGYLRYWKHRGGRGKILVGTWGLREPRPVFQSAERSYVASSFTEHIHCHKKTLRSVSVEKLENWFPLLDLALKMEAVCFSETLVSTYKSILPNNPGDQHRRQNLKPHMARTFSVLWRNFIFGVLIASCCVRAGLRGS
jgi:hypothetical protein